MMRYKISRLIVAAALLATFTAFAAGCGGYNSSGGGYGGGGMGGGPYATPMPKPTATH